MAGEPSSGSEISWRSHGRSHVKPVLVLVVAGSPSRIGYDVIVPQYLGRIGFIERLEALARRWMAFQPVLALRVGALLDYGVDVAAHPLPLRT
jgi:hypothetical protein